MRIQPGRSVIRFCRSSKAEARADVGAAGVLIATVNFSQRGFVIPDLPITGRNGYGLACAGIFANQLEGFTLNGISSNFDLADGDKKVHFCGIYADHFRQVALTAEVQTIRPGSQLHDGWCGVLFRRRVHRQSHDRLTGTNGNGGKIQKQGGDAENQPRRGLVKRPGMIFGFLHEQFSAIPMPTAHQQCTQL